MRGGWLRQRHPAAGQQAVVCTGPHLVASPLPLLGTVQRSECLTHHEGKRKNLIRLPEQLQCCRDTCCRQLNVMSTDVRFLVCVAALMRSLLR